MKLERQAVFAAVLLIFLCGGCGDDDDDIGHVTVEWSVAGMADPQACDRVGADRVEITFLSQDGSFVDEVEASCQDFTTTFDFPEGTYDITVRLITAQGEPVSNPLFFDDVLVEDASVALLHSEFPQSSIL